MDDTETDRDDQTADDRTAENDDGSRVDQLGDRIRSVRAQTAEVVEGVDGDDEKYAESGDEQSAREDDQTIAPPG